MKKILKYSAFSVFLWSLNIGAQQVQYQSFSDEFVIKGRFSSAQEELNQKITAMFSDPVMRNANWGLAVYDPKNKKMIHSYNENVSLIPASTTKLLTTETAMAILGKDFQWTTQLEYSGNIDEQGALHGNLYIIGSADPSLGTGRGGAATYSTIINDFTFSIKDLGIKRIKGDIVLKTAIFKNNKNNILPANIVWKNDKNYFLPMGSTNDTDPRQEKLIPSKKVENQKMVYLSPYTENLVYTEKFGGSYLSTKMPDATFYLGNNLKSNLTRNGIITEGVVVDRSHPQPHEEERKKIMAYQSPKLEELVYFINQTSNNAMSEALLKTTGFYKKGDFSLDTGKATVNKHLSRKSFEFQGFNFADGSGLSRSNVVTPVSQVKFLSSLMNEKYFDSYFKSLPIAGQTGTLKSSFQNSESYGQIFAKTGTLNRVKTLAGYVKTKTGKLLTFSLLINNYNGSVAQVKQKMESILAPLINF